MSDRKPEDLHASRVWDRLKDQLNQDDKRDFLNLYYIYSQDSIINCRKAELHIMLGSEKDDKAALALLENNEELLAFALKAKLLAVMPNMTGLEAYISQDFGECRKEQDFEGAIHFERAKLQHYYAKAEYSNALRCAQRAESIIDYLNLPYMKKVIKDDLSNIHARLGFVETAETLITGNNKLKRQSLYTTYSSLLLKGDFAAIEAEAFAARFKTLAKALKAKLEAKYSYALLLQHELAFEEITFQVHTYLLRLELFGRTNDSEYTQPKACLTGLESLLPKLKYKLQVLHDCAKLYPLGVSLAGLDVEVPILKNKHYRDGVHYHNKVLVFPNAAREVMIMDDLENTNSLNLLTKAQRYRMRQKLIPEELELHHVISEALLVKAKEQLRKVL